MAILSNSFFFGVLALFFVALLRYPLFGDLGPIIGVLLAGVFVAGMVLRDSRDRPVDSNSILAAILPWACALFFIANGALDRSNETRYGTVVVDYTFGTRLPSDWLTVRSWRPTRSTESFLSYRFRSRSQRGFHEGDPLTVGVKQGALGVPWISSVTTPDGR